jgi:hypothetical protein
VFSFLVGALLAVVQPPVSSTQRLRDNPNLEMVKNMIDKGIKRRKRIDERIDENDRDRIGRTEKGEEER